MKCPFTLALVLCACSPFVVSAQTPVTFAYDAAGNRILRLVSQNESALDSISSDTVLLTPLPIEDPAVLPEAIPPVRVYPNPTQGALTIYTPGASIPVNAPVYIFNEQGGLMRRETLRGAHTSMDITTFPNGLYIFRLITDKRVETIKVIKQ